MSSRLRSHMLPLGFIEPCQPSSAPKPPSGPDWVHEIKYDGFRLMAWRDGDRVRLYTRGGYDWADRYPAIARAVAALDTDSCFIDGEVVVCDEEGRPSFEMLRSRLHDGIAVLQAFDIISKRRNSPYKSGPTLNWIKSKAGHSS